MTAFKMYSCCNCNAKYTFEAKIFILPYSTTSNVIPELQAQACINTSCPTYKINIRVVPELHVTGTQ